VSSAEGTPASGGPVEIDHVQLAAPPGCEAQARAFYGGCWPARGREARALRAGGGVWFVLGANQIPHRGRRPVHAGAQGTSGAADGRRGRAPEALAARPAGRRRTSRGTRGSPRSGASSPMTPWGNRLELLCRPAGASAPIHKFATLAAFRSDRVALALPRGTASVIGPGLGAGLPAGQRQPENRALHHPDCW